MFSGKEVVFGQRGCIRAKLFFRAKVVLFGKKKFYSDKVVVFGQNGSIREKWMYFDKSGCIRAKGVLVGQKWLY